MADETTGTPAVTTGDGAATASGTPAVTQAGGAVVVETPESLKARIAELESVHKQDLTRLSAGEEARRKLEELESQAGQPTLPPAGYDPAAQHAQQTVAELWQRVQQGDGEAIAQVMAATVQAAQQEAERTRVESRWYRELDQIPASQKAAVEERAKRDRVMPSVAHRFIKADTLDAKEHELAEQTRKLQEEQDRLRRGVVSTTASPTPAAPASDELSPEDYAKIARAAAFGDREARKKIRDVDEGRLKVRTG